MTTEAEQAYQEIFDRIIPEAVEFFRTKTKDYSGGPGFLLLGSRGQFSDITRKWLKLYQAVWEGRELVGEQPQEIVQDFIGHCFLLLYTLEHEATKEAW